MLGRRLFDEKVGLRACALTAISPVMVGGVALGGYVVRLALILIALVLLRQMSLGLADYWEWIFGAVWLVGLAAFFLSRKRQKAALSVSGPVPVAR